MPVSSRRVLFLGLGFFGLLGCASDPDPEPEPVLPDELAFAFTRPGADALPPAEVTAFTRKATGFFKAVDYFAWVRSVSHGVDASTGKPDFSLWWHDVAAVKQGDLVTFRHGTGGGGHNVYIPTSKVLAQAAGAYLLTKDRAAGRVVELYAKGIAAACRGFVYDQNDTNRSLMARNFVAQNHQYEIEGGRKTAVDFTPWYSEYQHWNAHRFQYTSNPYWGDVWVTNMRSKDDVPHIYVAALFLKYVAEYAEDPAIKEAARLGLECASGFAKDVVDSGYRIRTKDKMGKAYIPTEDLASFVQYEEITPNGECAAKLTSAFLGYGDSRGNDCGMLEKIDYEAIATSVHYYNYAIVRTFHLSALLAALIAREDAAAKKLLTGLALRIDRYLDPRSDEPGRSNDRWVQDLAPYLLQSAAVGLPLKPAEARMIQEQYSASFEKLTAWTHWNIWDASVPDGSDVAYLPDDHTIVRMEEIAYLFLYCFSPFKNPAGAAPVDCEVVRDPGRWGS